MGRRDRHVWGMDKTVLGTLGFGGPKTQDYSNLGLCHCSKRGRISLEGR